MVYLRAFYGVRGVFKRVLGSSWCTRTGARSGARSPGVLVPSRALEGRVGCAFPNDLLRLAEVWTEGLGARGTKEGR